MKKVLLAGFLYFIMQVAGAQKVYFIYIQSENNAPFFVKMGDKVASSTASGYLILPKLVDSVYQFTLGRTGQAETEYRFSVAINKKDRGFLLKETDGKTALFDLQSLSLLSPVASAHTSNETMAKRTDAFAVMLAQAANDPSLLEIRTAATIATTTTKPEPAPAQALVVTANEPEEEVVGPRQSSVTDTVVQTEIASANTAPAEEMAKAEIASQIKDTAAIENSVQDIESGNPEPAQNTIPEEAETYTKSVITRKSESSTTEGFGLVFLDNLGDAVDTIRLVIPNPSISFLKEEKADEDSKKFLNISNEASTSVDSSVALANSKLAAAERNRACKASASENDFYELRKNMAAKEGDDDMIAEARKAFKKACFSTEQIKNLSSLFLTAGGKYQFFDAAYRYVSNQEQYANLQAELNDAYYINRFKSLIVKQ